MRLAVDVREACAPQRTGKGQWTYGFVCELLAREHEILPVTNREMPEEWKSARAVRIDGTGLSWHRRAAAWVRAQKPDFYVSPTSYLVPWLLGNRAATVTIIHDLIAFRREPHDRKATFIERMTLSKVVRTSRHLFTVSDATKSDLLVRYPSLTPEQVTALYAGPMLDHPAPRHSDTQTILCVATLCPRKNQLRLIQAYASLAPELRERFRLVLVGARGWLDAEILRLAETTPGVEWRSYVDDYEYQRLLSSCHVFALPSLYEGFGMQILDALQRGIPILTSDRGSLGELVGDAACVVDPERVESIAAGLTQLLTDDAYRTSIATKGPARASQYSWKRTVDTFLGTISALDRGKFMV